MLKHFKYGVACVIAAGLLFLFTGMAGAVDNEPVLRSIGHENTDTVMLSGSTREVTLTVPYAYGQTTVDLFNGLSFTYGTGYASVVLIPDSAATVNGGGVSVTVTYRHANEAESDPKSQTIYTLRVVKDDPVPARFSGTIAKTGVYPGPESLSLSASDFTSLYAQNDGHPLSSIVINGSNSAAGRLRLAGEDYAFGAPVAASSLSSLTFAVAGAGRASYDVTAYTAEAPSTPVGTATLTVTISALPLPVIQNDLIVSAVKGTAKTFTAANFAGVCNLNGGNLRSVEIIPGDIARGTWRLGTELFTVATTVQASQIPSLSFTPSVAGEVAFSFKVASEAGSSGSGHGMITVSSPTLVPSSYSAPSNIIKGATLDVSASHFVVSPSSAGLTYIKINTPPQSADGYLYLSVALPKDAGKGYPAIAANKSLGAGAIIPYEYLSYLRFATKSGAANSASFIWCATADANASSAAWSSSAYYSLQFVTAGGVSYETDINTPVTFRASDFSNSFYLNAGRPLSYVTFTLPPAASGVLYHNYDLTTKKGSKAGASTKYYVGADPNLSYLTFVPAADYTGTVTVSYKAYIDDGAYTTGTLTIRVANSAGGTVSYGTDKDSPLQLEAGDFANAFLKATGRTLSYVEFSLPSSTTGRLYYNYTSDGSYDSTVSSSRRYYVYSSPYLSYVSFVPYEGYTGVVTISFTGHTESGSEYSGKLKINVLDSPGGTVTYTMGKNAAIRLSAEDFAEEFIGVTGSILSYLTFAQPAAASGTLVYNYSPETKKGTKVGNSTKFYPGGNPDISDITFVPADGFSGTVTIGFTAYTAGGVSYAGKLKCIVSEEIGKILSYTVDSNRPFLLYASDFTNNFYENTDGALLSYVTFTLPSTTYGKFYYNYNASAGSGTAVSASTRYYPYSAPSLGSVSFVPYRGYFGSFTVSYTGFSDDGTSYEGKIKITIGSDTVGNVNYRTTSRSAVTFRAADFTEALRNETGKNLYYVRFTNLPSSSAGRLYYNYSSSLDYSSSVSASTKYYANGYPYLSSVAFVPDASFSGVVSLDYTAYDYDENSYSGLVTVTVGGGDGGGVAYETDANTPVFLNTGDFNDAFRERTGTSLSYVRFTLPSTTYGRLYYNYVSPSRYDTTVSSTTSYYTDSYPYLSSVAFVPAADYRGEVSVSYSAHNLYGESYSGVLTITVKQGTAGEVRLETVKNTPVALNPDDFNAAFLENTGSTLSYVTFTLPSASYGQLYFGYRSPTSYSSRVSASTKYYRSSSPLLSEVSFVPKDGYTGAVVITYTGYTSAGRGYPGELTIDVADDAPPFFDIDDNYLWALDAITYLYREQVVTGDPNGAFLPGSAVSRGDLILMAYRAFDLSGVAAFDNFEDVPAGSYYYEAIATAKALGVALGSDGNFYPDSAISRQDAMVILARLMDVMGEPLTEGTQEDLAFFTDLSAVSDYALPSVSSLVKSGIITGSNGGLHPRDSINRAEMAVILHRILNR